MPEQQKQPIILTLTIDEKDQRFFNAQRKLYFPAERNFLDAHLLLFHQLADAPATFEYFAELRHQTFLIRVTGLLNLGAGVAYQVDSPELRSLHRVLSTHFGAQLIPQDRQGFRPHITIMNKTTPEQARYLIRELSPDFEPFTIKATGLDLWTYLGGPWQHQRYFAFKDILA